MIQKVARDNKVPLTVIRQGKTIKLDLPVKSHYPKLIEPPFNDAIPSFDEELIPWE